MARFVDPVLQKSYSISVQFSSHELKVSLADASSQHEDLVKRFDNLSTILTFLANNFFLHIPLEEAVQLKQSISKSVATSALNHLLIPALPSSFGLLPSFLKLLKRAVSFEEEDISGLLEKEFAIKTWSDGVAGHYERRRRVDILEKARTEILALDDARDVFVVAEGPEVILPMGNSIESDSGEIDAWGLDEPSSLVVDENGHNFDGSDPVDDTGGWAFDESINEDATWGLDEGMTALPEEFSEKEPDLTHTWGWNDAKTADEFEDNAWDDPWATSTEAIEIEPSPKAETTSSPKAAIRLEKKLASKKKQNSSLPLLPPGIPITDTTVSVPPRKEAQERYLIPERTKSIMKMVETVIDEGKLFYASNLFDGRDVAPPPGTILSQSALSILDLYRAVYPIKHAKALEEPKNAFLFSNSCLYLAGAIQRLEDTLYGESILKERLAEYRANLQVASDSWFGETIVSIFSHSCCVLGHSRI